MMASSMIKYQNGMNEVYRPPKVGEDAQTPIANIVFIHGLFGHPWKTWADEKVKDTKKPFWPEDLLPSAVPNAAIYSFGYDADVERFMSAAGLNTVHQHGRNLLNDLCDLLDKCDTKIPLIFIVHSLGGLVLKEALNQSSGTETRRSKQIAELTYGVIFLGTPHRGSSVASYGKMAFLLTKVFAGQSANTQLLRALERDSETLDRINSTFYETLKRFKNIHLFSFFEEKETRKAIFGVRIVPPECARIADEDWAGIPENHRYMAKFKSYTDPGFRKVSNVVRRWIVGIEEDEKKFLLRGYKECLESLDNPSARARVQQVSQQHKDSFEWLYDDTVRFSRWLQDDENEFSPIFWITGKPGSGKSTLMRFAMQDPRTLDLLPDGTGHPVAYFFHLRGKSHIQKSLNGMLLEITYQVLAQFPEFFLSIKEIYTDLLRVWRRNKTGWNTETLKRCVLRILHFLHSLKQSQQQSFKETQPRESRTRIVLFIDALDENEDQSENHEVVSIVKELAEVYSNSIFQPGVGPVLKICLASRPWPIFQKQLGDEKRVLSFAIQDHTKEDIRLYCMSRLSSAISDRATFKEQAQYWVEMIAGKAHGVFIWVRLVVDYLCRNIIDGTPYPHLEAYLRSLPDELSNLYEFTLSRIPKEYTIEALVSLRILLASRTSLTLDALYSATLSCTFEYHDNMMTQDKLAWLRSRTGGLVEIAFTDTIDTEPHVQFIHQTVQEFVLKGLSGLRLDPDEQHWIRVDGNFYIFKAVAQRHPPYQPLLPLAQDIFYYLKAMDHLVESDTSRRAMERILSEWTSADQPESAFFWIYKESSKMLRISRKDILSYYITPKNQRVLLELTNWVDSNLTLQRGHQNDQGRDLIKKSEDEFRGLGRFFGGPPADVMQIMLRQAFILHGIYHVNYGAFPAGNEVPSVLLIAALGPRFTVEDANRPRLFQKICNQLATYPLHDTNFLSIPKIIAGLKHSIIKAVEPVGFLETLVFCEEHPDVDEDTRFHMTEIILAALPESTRLMMIRRMISGECLAMSLLDFCARFKSRRWTQLIYSYDSEQPPFALPEYIPLAAALGKDKVTIQDLCNAFNIGGIPSRPLDSGANEGEWTELEYEKETDKGWGIYLIPAMVAALSGCPSACMAAFNRHSLPEQIRLTSL